MDELLAAVPSRVVTVASNAHQTPTGYIDLKDPMLTQAWSPSTAYANSKLANIIFTRELGHRLKGEIDYTLLCKV